MAKKYTARCACGDVKFEFEFDTDPTFIAICHCLDCKKASGGEAATFFGVPEKDFTPISGEPKAFRAWPSQARNWIETTVRRAARACSPATLRASRERFSCSSAAWIILRASSRSSRCSQSAASNG